MNDDKPLERIAVRELRNYASRVVRRARSGERLIVTVDGVPAAEIGPLRNEPSERSLQELIAAGLVSAPRRSDPPPPARPVSAPRSTLDVLSEQRDQR
ncbi:hypothetical protein BH24CHL7_BH24CHL7_14320 [soil metagenome]